MSNFIQGEIDRRLSKEIDVVAIFKKYGSMRPTKFYIDGKVIKIDKIDSVKDSSISGDNYRVFVCRSYVDNVEKIYELKFVYKTFRWYLF